MLSSTRTPLFTLLFAAIYAPIVFQYALNAPIQLDENLALEQAREAPLRVDSTTDYLLAVDTPVVFVWINHFVLKASGIEIGDVPASELSKPYDWNIVNGRVAPRRPVMVLRCASATAYLFALVTLFIAAAAALHNHAWGFVVGALLALPSGYGEFVAGGIRTDAYLSFFLALSLLTWLLFHYSHAPLAAWRVAVTGMVIGLAISTKYNAGLVLLAYMTYLAVSARGARRITLPALSAVTAFAVFTAINPVMWKAFVPGNGGPLWWVHVGADALARRQDIYRLHQGMLGTKDPFDLIGFFLPWWYLLPIVALLAVQSRHEKWFPPVALWAVFLIVGTMLTVRQPFTRYRLPLDFGLYMLAVLSLASVLRRLRRGELTLRQLLTRSAGEVR